MSLRDPSRVNLLPSLFSDMEPAPVFFSGTAHPAVFLLIPKTRDPLRVTGTAVQYNQEIK